MGGFLYTEITLKDQIQTLHNVIRDTEMKHFLAKLQADANRAHAEQFRMTDKRRFTAMRDQANKDDGDAAQMALSLDYVRARLDKLIESDPDNAPPEEAESDALTKLALVKDESA